MIHLRFATVEPTEWGCISHFHDGTTVPAQHHHWDHHYHVISHRCGYGDDTARYALEHEVCHHLICEALYGAPSPILWGIAHDRPPPPGYCAFEELATQALQRWVRANERPIVGGVPWDSLKTRALELLEGEKR